MSWAQRQAQVYPDDTNVTARMMRMPVQAPARPRQARKRRPVADCDACTTEPCKRHGYDVLASIGAVPAEPLSPDELVHDWRPV